MWVIIFILILLYLQFLPTVDYYKDYRNKKHVLLWYYDFYRERKYIVIYNEN